MSTISSIWALIAFVCSFGAPSLAENSSFNGEGIRCETTLDSITKRKIYTVVDKEAVNEGGRGALLKQFEKIIPDSITVDLDAEFIIAFIVGEDGQISGERVVKDHAGKISREMIRISKSFKWTAAECSGQKVPALVTLRLEGCPAED